MNSATLVKLGDLATIVAGQSPSSDFYSSSGTAFLQGNRTFGNLYPTIDSYTKKVTKLAQEGDVLISVRAPVGDLNIAPQDLCIGRGLAALNSKTEDNLFLYYALKYNVKTLLMRQAGGTTFSSIDKDELLQLDMVVPSNKFSYSAIGKFLWLLDKKIDVNDKIIKEFESYLDLLYKYWFVQYDFPDKNDKPYKSSGGNINDGSLRAPDGWQIKRVKDIATLQTGISYTSDDIEAGSGLPMINLGSIDKNRKYRDEKIKYYSGIVGDNKIAYPGDLLVACTDLTSDGLIVGCPIFVPSHHEKFTYSMDLSRVNIMSEAIKPVYLYMTLRTEWYHAYIKKFASGTNVRHLDVDGVLRYEIAVPPINLQEKFEGIAQPMFDTMNDLLVQNQELTTLRDWLLPLLMTGQTKVK